MMSLPEDRDSSTSAATSTKSGTGVLSRTSLYTPLSSYTAQRANSSSNNNNNNKKQQNIAKNVQESSLTEFIATTVSSAYHLSSEGRSKSIHSNNNQKVHDDCCTSSSSSSPSSVVTVLSVKHARNTGNRPLHVGEINSRIRQRALTLVGGGYNASVVVNDGAVTGAGNGAGATTKQAMNAHGKRSAVAVASRTSADRQQRRQRKRRKKRIASTEQKPAVVASDGDGGDGPIPVTAGAGASAVSTATTTTDTTCTDNGDNINVDMLQQLHTMWLEYLWNLLGMQLPAAGATRNGKGSINGHNNNNKKTKKGAAGTTTQPLELVRSKLPKLLLQTTTAAATAATGTGTTAVMELVGAKVRVQACTRHPAWMGRTGIIVQATADTYQIVGPVDVAQVPATLKDAVDVTTATQTQTHTPPTIQTWIIPKRGSRLELLLPVDLPNKHGTTVDPFSKSSSDQPQLCILLDSNQHQVAKINKQ
jgi:RNase P/RNase MRP subunit p29